MNKICSQTSVIEVDESVPKCSDFISTDCIIAEQARSYLSLPENATLTEVLDALLASLVDARNRIITLENN